MITGLSWIHISTLSPLYLCLALLSQFPLAASWAFLKFLLAHPICARSIVTLHLSPFLTLSSMIIIA